MRSPRNQTLCLTSSEVESLERQIHLPEKGFAPNRIYNCDFQRLIQAIPEASIDLLFLDPPYNLRKNFNGSTFKRSSSTEYAAWLDRVIAPLVPLCKPSSSIYVCGDWRSSSAIQSVCERYFHVQNRITFEREKGRSSSRNWKNASEDIWFCTMSQDYCFDAKSVQLKKRVIAPYRLNGRPRDWSREGGTAFRLTGPSNLWGDITIPFWSMPENTPHPTQKPEKLLARILLASTRPGDLVFDPFCGSGTTPVVAKKLARDFIACDIDREYCLFALKRLSAAESDKSIQGYVDGVFWERNSGPASMSSRKT